MASARRPSASACGAGGVRDARAARLATVGWRVIVTAPGPGPGRGARPPGRRRGSLRCGLRPLEGTHHRDERRPRHRRGRGGWPQCGSPRRGARVGRWCGHRAQLLGDRGRPVSRVGRADDVLDGDVDGAGDDRGDPGAHLVGGGRTSGRPTPGRGAPGCRRRAGAPRRRADRAGRSPPRRARHRAGRAPRAPTGRQRPPGRPGSAVRPRACRTAQVRSVTGHGWWPAPRPARPTPGRRRGR